MASDEDKPEVHMNIAKLDENYSTVTSLYHAHHNDLIEAMDKSMQFHNLFADVCE